MNNPFSIAFGKEPQAFINAYEQFDIIKNTFSAEFPVTNTYLITGVRGSGKTVLLTRLGKYFEKLSDWIVVDLNPEINMIEYLASSIYEKSNAKFKFAKKDFSFSFSGLSISISGEKPVSNIITLLENLFEVVKKKSKKVLICIDDVSNNENVRAFVQQYQIFIRKDYPIYLLMTGLYENVKSLQNEKSLTFLYRVPQIQINTLSLINIAESYENELGVSHEESVKMSKLTNGYAFAYQVLGYIMFDTNKKLLNVEVINMFDTYLREYVYEKIYYDLPNGEKDLICALAVNNEDKISSATENTAINRASLSQYRARLIKKGVLVKTGWGKVDFALPRFKEYILLQSEFEDRGLA